MLLSIVESGNYRQHNPDLVLPVNILEHGDFEIIGPNIGPNVANMRNSGAEQARGRWVFFKDKDCKIDPIKLYGYVKEMEKKRGPWGAVGGFYSSECQTLLAQAYHWIQWNWVRRGLSGSRQESICQAQHLLGGAFLVKKEAFTSVGGFNENIGWGGEEIDLVHRLIKEDFLVGVSARIRVGHNNNLGFWGLCKRAWFQNLHRQLYPLTSVDLKTSISTLSYLRAPLRIAPWVGLFFSVAIVASLYGRLNRVLSLLLGKLRWILPPKVEILKWFYLR